MPVVPSVPLDRKEEQMRKVISKIKEKMSEIRISHNTISNSNKNNGELILNINYPQELSLYPYIYCRF
jgi:hypothetical protein